MSDDRDAKLNKATLDALCEASGDIVTQMVNQMTPQEQQTLIANLAGGNPLELRLQLFPVVRLVVGMTSAPEQDERHLLTYIVPGAAPIDPMKLN